MDVPSALLGAVMTWAFSLGFPRTSTDTWIHSRSTTTFPKSAGRSSLLALGTEWYQAEVMFGAFSIF